MFISVMKFLSALILVVSTSAQGLVEKKPVIVDVNPARLVRIVGVIDAQILTAATRIRTLSSAGKDARKPIYVMLNSPGGEVFPGSIFISSIKQARLAGTPVICFSAVYAASMAFNIMMHCSERYILESTRLLFHPVRIQTYEPLTAPMMRKYAAGMDRLDGKLIKFISDEMRVDISVISENYYEETFWKGEELSELSPTFFKIADDIRGVNNLFQYRKGNEADTQETPSLLELKKIIGTTQKGNK